MGVEQIYTFEIFVETLKFSEVMPKLQHLNVVVEIGDVVKAQIRTDLFATLDKPIKDQTPGEYKLNCGKLIMFPAEPSKMVEQLDKGPFRFNIFSSGELLASAEEPWKPDFSELVKLEKMTEKVKQVSATMDGNYDLVKDLTVRVIGTIQARVRLTYYGSTVESNFKVMDANDVTTKGKQYLFKNESGANFQCEKGEEPPKVDAANVFPLCPILNSTLSIETVTGPFSQYKISFTALSTGPTMSVTPDEFQSVSRGGTQHSSALSYGTFDILSIVEREPKKNKALDLHVKASSVGFSFTLNDDEKEQQNILMDAVSQEEELTVERIEQKLCKNKDCPALKKFKRYGIGPLASNKGVGQKLSVVPPCAYGLSNECERLENYGPEGVFSRPKRADDPFVRKRETLDDFHARCWKPKRKSDDGLRLRGGGINYEKTSHPLAECQDIMAQFDEVLQKYKQALGPCGKATCPFVPNILNEVCRTSCKHKDEVVMENLPEVEPPRPVGHTPTELRGACGSPKCPFPKYREGVAAEDDAAVLQYLPPASSRACGSPTCVKQYQSPLPPIHWDCPDPLPKGRCTNPNCPYFPDDLKNMRKEMIKRMVERERPPPCEPPPPQPPLYEIGMNCNQPSCPFAQPQDSDCGNPDCPYAQPKEDNCGNPDCPYAQPDESNCGEPDCPYARPKTVDCSNPKCPYAQPKAEDCGSIGDVCDNPECPYGTPEPDCTNPECPFASRPPPPPPCSPSPCFVPDELPCRYNAALEMPQPYSSLPMPGCPVQNPCCPFAPPSPHGLRLLFPPPLNQQRGDVVMCYPNQIICPPQSYGRGYQQIDARGGNRAAPRRMSGQGSSSRKQGSSQSLVQGVKKTSSKTSGRSKYRKHLDEEEAPKIPGMMEYSSDTRVQSFDSAPCTPRTCKMQQGNLECQECDGGREAKTCCGMCRPQPMPCGGPQPMVCPYHVPQNRSPDSCAVCGGSGVGQESGDNQNAMQCYPTQMFCGQRPVCSCGACPVGLSQGPRSFANNTKSGNDARKPESSQSLVRGVKKTSSKTSGRSKYRKDIEEEEAPKIPGMMEYSSDTRVQSFDSAPCTQQTCRMQQGDLECEVCDGGRGEVQDDFYGLCYPQPMPCGSPQGMLCPFPVGGAYEICLAPGPCPWIEKQKQAARPALAQSPDERKQSSSCRNKSKEEVAGSRDECGAGGDRGASKEGVSKSPASSKDEVTKDKSGKPYRRNIEADDGHLKPEDMEYTSDTRVTHLDSAPCTKKTCKSKVPMCEECGGKKALPDEQVDDVAESGAICSDETCQNRQEAGEVIQLVPLKKHRKIRGRYVYSLGNRYPKLQPTHKKCILTGKAVPAHMGWLWNLPALGMKKRKGWRPGMLGKTMAAIIQRHRESQGLKFQEPVIWRKGKKHVGNHYSSDSEESIHVEPRPTLQIKKKDGAYYVTMNPLKDPYSLMPNEDPYMNCTPMQFKITKNKNEKSNNPDDKLCFCDDCGEIPSSSSDSELDIEFTPPAGLIHPQNFHKLMNVVHTDTQYLQADYDPEAGQKKKDKKGKKGKKDKKGKKGKKGGKGKKK